MVRKWLAEKGSISPDEIAARDGYAAFSWAPILGAAGLPEAWDLHARAVSNARAEHASRSSVVTSGSLLKLQAAMGKIEDLGEAMGMLIDSALFGADDVSDFVNGIGNTLRQAFSDQDPAVCEALITAFVEGMSRCGESPFVGVSREGMLDGVLLRLLTGCWGMQFQPRLAKAVIAAFPPSSLEMRRELTCLGTLAMNFAESDDLTGAVQVLDLIAQWEPGMETLYLGRVVQESLRLKNGEVAEALISRFPANDSQRTPLLLALARVRRSAGSRAEADKAIGKALAGFKPATELHAITSMIALITARQNGLDRETIELWEKAVG